MCSWPVKLQHTQTSRLVVSMELSLYTKSHGLPKCPFQKISYHFILVEIYWKRPSIQCLQIYIQKLHQSVLFTWCNNQTLALDRTAGRENALKMSAFSNFHDPVVVKIFSSYKWWYQKLGNPHYLHSTLSETGKHLAILKATSTCHLRPNF